MDWVADSKEIVLRRADILTLERELSELKSEEEIYAYIKQRATDLENAREVHPH